ncbi:MAG TPA: hypothetical protein VGS19_30335 [Streptosporangiaceae bacterium]|nr:hypothetical protein [Streptosporangiaceae bacterium]
MTERDNDATVGAVSLDDVDWDSWSVVYLKPDCLRTDRAGW